MTSVLVISPSGNFYGSEQVLADYLRLTKSSFSVAVPRDSKFYSILSGFELSHRIVPYDSNRLLIFYFKIFLWLLGGRFKTVYVNEAGHSRYILLLAKIFPKVRFVVHVRISEDTDSSRWRSPKPLNLTLIAISDFIRDKLRCDSIKLYDLYNFPEKLPIIRRKMSKPVRVAIIGRITYSKGFLEFVKLVERLQVRAMAHNYHFNLYGDLADDVKKSPLLSSLMSGNGIFFKGFVTSRDDLYAQNDIILHLSKVEPLGRIFFEAISFAKPLIGFNCGGIGEIGRLTGLEQYLVNPECENEADELIEKLEWARVFEDHQLILSDALKAMKKTFGHFRYVEELDNLLIS